MKKCEGNLRNNAHATFVGFVGGLFDLVSLINLAICKGQKGKGIVGDRSFLVATMEVGYCLWFSPRQSAVGE